MDSLEEQLNALIARADRAQAEFERELFQMRKIEDAAAYMRFVRGALAVKIADMLDYVPDAPDPRTLQYEAPYAGLDQPMSADPFMNGRRSGGPVANGPGSYVSARHPQPLNFQTAQFPMTEYTAAEVERQFGPYADGYHRGGWHQ